VHQHEIVIRLHAAGLQKIGLVDNDVKHVGLTVIAADVVCPQRRRRQQSDKTGN
jgi:hypothetical protein